MGDIGYCSDSTDSFHVFLLCTYSTITCGFQKGLRTPSNALCRRHCCSGIYFQSSLGHKNNILGPGKHVPHSRVKPWLRVHGYTSCSSVLRYPRNICNKYKTKLLVFLRGHCDWTETMVTRVASACSSVMKMHRLGFELSNKSKPRKFSSSLAAQLPFLSQAGHMPSLHTSIFTDPSFRHATNSTKRTS